VYFEGIAAVAGSLFAVSDLHCSYPENQRIANDLRPQSGDDWLIVAGDVGEIFGETESALRLLRQRHAKVIWAPGNHELWTHREDPIQLRGDARYQALVQMCQDNDILTPEDEFAVWPGPTGPMTIVPLFQLYDHSWLSPARRPSSSPCNTSTRRPTTIPTSLTRGAEARLRISWITVANPLPHRASRGCGGQSQLSFQSTTRRQTLGSFSR
jgi:3',5'-cyclic AMP phosphodiesterase CpdA